MNKYKLSDETKTTPEGVILHRVVATKTFTLACGITINAGDLGGWIEKESNLSGNAWVSDEAQVYGDARVTDGAIVAGKAIVSDNMLVSGNAMIWVLSDGLDDLSSQDDIQL